MIGAMKERLRWALFLVAICYVVISVLLFRSYNSKNNAAADHPPSLSIPRRELGRKGSEADETTVLSRKPSRIPGYISGSNATYYGYVMRDFASRVLSRHIVGSGADVLVVSKDLPSHSSSNDIPMLDEEQDLKSRYSIGRSFIRHSQLEGHRVHGVGIGGRSNATSSNLLTWWASFSSPPSWILLAVFDPPIGSEDALISSESASRLLSECTVTYIVFRVSATWFRGSQPIFGGGEAVRELVRHGYKVQLLSSSHSIESFPPNTLLGESNVIHFLSLGVQVTRKSDADANNGAFNAYLFATQGLDLAIPSQREYVSTLGAGRTKIDKATGEAILSLKSCKAEAEVSFRPRGEVDEMIRRDGIDISPARRFLQNVDVFCGASEEAVVDPKRLSRIWMSASEPELSEAVCVQLEDCGGASACATRIIPREINPTQFETQAVSAKERRMANESPNLLVLMIDPISRPLFDQALPRTKQLLIDLGFTPFDNYTVVGDNSGPNQAALYSGQGLSARQDISSSSKGSFRWIWDDLRDKGYATYKAEDGCIRNSNMVQSIQPDTTHGSVIHEMMCFDFSRPNCVGGKAASRHLTGHASEFIQQYSERGHPWAAFVSFIDSHEDTNMLAATLDDPLYAFLSDLKATKPQILDNTLVAVLSDHGLHYGSYIQSYQGKRERARPVLFLKPPRKYPVEVLKSNRGLWTTPFDVYATFRDVLLQEHDGSSLLVQLSQDRLKCQGVEAIPRRYCDLFRQHEQQQKDEHAEMTSPASMLSYYADIPKKQKQQKEACAKGDVPSASSLYHGPFDKVCACSTSHRTWYDCKQHPWLRRFEQNSAAEPHEYFAFIDCPNRTLYMETRVEQDPAIAKRRHKPTSKRPLNILFIEIDSASVAYADRHFPKTREYLSKHRIHKDNNGQYACASEICAADFTRFSVTGPNSISNQVSALSGCVTSHPEEQCEKVAANGVCTDPGMVEHGLRHHKTFRNASSVWCTADANAEQTGSSPWLFDVARESGYVTSFGEEFCCNSSPYVTQDNIFDLHSDINIHNAHCRLAERYLKQHNLPIYPKKLWKGNSGFHLPCVDGTAGKAKAQIPFEHILQMWDAYSDMPRFAFLNAMAAHDYSPRWEAMPLGAEEYDGMLLGFLKKMLATDAGETVIVLRSDHGLQDGPSIVDYSSQVEHSRPWTEIIVPKSLEELDLEALSSNQDRLASGFDLYRTLRHLMSLTSEDGTDFKSLTPSVPDWSINILTTKIPKSRSCRDGRIPIELCRNELEKTFIAPSYGTCNKFDPTLRFFCPKESGERRKVGGIVTAMKPKPQSVSQMNAERKVAAEPIQKRKAISVAVVGEDQERSERGRWQD